MALIKCKECGKQVSDTCETCPNCGADIQQQVFDSLPQEEQNKIIEQDTARFNKVCRVGCWCIRILGLGIIISEICIDARYVGIRWGHYLLMALLWLFVLPFVVKRGVIFLLENRQ